MGTARQLDNAGIRIINRRRLGEDAAQASPDSVIEECAVALVYNGVSHAVMMATPIDLEDFALGFSLSEGILTEPSQLLGVDIVHAANGIELQLEILTGQFEALKGRRRQVAGRSGCGMCGKESLEQALLPLPTLPDVDRVSVTAIHRAIEALASHQPIQQQTGASHAAAWCDGEGNPELVREDVGRHNALDKLIGARRRLAGDISRDSTPAITETGFALVTSRASYELVAKAALANISTLVALSAPTSLAVDTAMACNLNLIAFAGTGSPVVYQGTTE